ncbi:hypothetical protein FJZ26_01190 [Candidatus Parvarchaeota archaeon]|nr:hypothetical protein [Candidatus Parvarchaeota archaeon]
MIPILAITVLSAILETIAAAVKYFSIPFLDIITVVLIPVSLVLYGYAGYTASKKYSHDKIVGALAGGLTGFVSGVASAIIKVALILVVSALKPNAQDTLSSLMTSYLPKGTGVLIINLLCVGIIVPLSICGGLMAGYIGSMVAQRRK